MRISVNCFYYTKKFQVTESSSANRTKNIAQQYFCVIERTTQEEILERFFMLGLVLPRVAVTAATLAFSPTKTRTLFAKSSQRFLKVAAQYVPISKGIKPAHIERLTMKNYRNAVAALLIAGFALTSTTT